MSKNKIKDKEVEYTINNIVLRTKLDLINEEKINLRDVALKDYNSEPPSENFPGLIMRLKKATALVFDTGSVITTGLKYEKDIESTLQQIYKNIRKIGIKFEEIEREVVNYVSSGFLGVGVDLDKATLVMNYVMYEPEVFPGLVYRMPEPKVVFLIFASGSFVATGVRTRENLKQGVQKLYREITSKALGFDPLSIPGPGEYKPPSQSESQDELIFI
jgi:transcription initiation factor TFIID TATA-box-binding protein